jgi:hypothetical protein
MASKSNSNKRARLHSAGAETQSTAERGELCGAVAACLAAAQEAARWAEAARERICVPRTDVREEATRASVLACIDAEELAARTALEQEEARLDAWIEAADSGTDFLLLPLVLFDRSASASQSRVQLSVAHSSSVCARALACVRFLSVHSDALVAAEMDAHPTFTGARAAALLEAAVLTGEHVVVEMLVSDAHWAWGRRGVSFDLAAFMRANKIADWEHGGHPVLRNPSLFCALAPLCPVDADTDDHLVELVCAMASRGASLDSARALTAHPRCTQAFERYNQRANAGVVLIAIFRNAIEQPQERGGALELFLSVPACAALLHASPAFCTTVAFYEVTSRPVVDEVRNLAACVRAYAALVDASPHAVESFLYYHRSPLLAHCVLALVQARARRTGAPFVLTDNRWSKFLADAFASCTDTPMLSALILGVKALTRDTNLQCQMLTCIADASMRAGNARALGELASERCVDIARVLENAARMHDPPSVRVVRALLKHCECTDRHISSAMRFLVETSRNIKRRVDLKNSCAARHRFMVELASDPRTTAADLAHARVFSHAELCRKWNVLLDNALGSAIAARARARERLDSALDSVSAAASAAASSTAADDAEL